VAAMMDVYTSPASATPAPIVEPERELWLAVSSAEMSGEAWFPIPETQAWFWTPEWQDGEREVDEHIAAGRTTYFESTEEFLAALDREAR
jgi:hypothetical protein